MLTRKFPNIHFPSIGNMKIYKFHGKTYYIYLIEKLDKYSERYCDWQIKCDILSLIAKNFYANYDPFYSIEKNFLWNNYYDPLTQKECKEFVESLKKDTSMLNALQTIGVYAAATGTVVDIHNDNVMMRNNKVIVFADPLAFYKKFHK